MKKFIVSFFVVATFIGYSLRQQFGLGDEGGTVTPPTNMASIPTTNTTTNTNTSLPAVPIITARGDDAESSDDSTYAPSSSSASSPASAKPVPTNTSNTVNKTPNKPTPVMVSGQYKNGTYIGSVADAYYGYVQVQVTISGGKISDVVFLQSPNDRQTSKQINSIAMPYLKQEVIQSQTALVNTISGASATSGAFRESMQSALQKAS